MSVKGIENVRGPLLGRVNKSKVEFKKWRLKFVGLFMRFSRWCK